MKFNPCRKKNRRIKLKQILETVKDRRILQHKSSRMRAVICLQGSNSYLVITSFAAGLQHHLSLQQKTNANSATLHFLQEAMAENSKEHLSGF